MGKGAPSPAVTYASCPGPGRNQIFLQDTGDRKARRSDPPHSLDRAMELAVALFLLHPPIHPSIYSPTQPPIHSPIYPSSYHPLSYQICLLIHPPIHSPTHPFIHACIHPSTYPAIHLLSHSSTYLPPSMGRYHLSTPFE